MKELLNIFELALCIWVLVLTSMRAYGEVTLQDIESHQGLLSSEGVHGIVVKSNREEADKYIKESGVYPTEYVEAPGMMPEREVDKILHESKKNSGTGSIERLIKKLSDTCVKQLNEHEKGGGDIMNNAILMANEVIRRGGEKEMGIKIGELRRTAAILQRMCDGE